MLNLLGKLYNLYFSLPILDSPFLDELALSLFFSSKTPRLYSKAIIPTRRLTSVVSSDLRRSKPYFCSSIKTKPVLCLTLESYLPPVENHSQ